MAVNRPVCDSCYCRLVPWRYQLAKIRKNYELRIMYYYFLLNALSDIINIGNSLVFMAKCLANSLCSFVMIVPEPHRCRCGVACRAR